jgi:hypothetical protein
MGLAMESVLKLSLGAKRRVCRQESGKQPMNSYKTKIKLHLDFHQVIGILLHQMKFESHRLTVVAVKIGAGCGVKAAPVMP